MTAFFAVVFFSGLRVLLAGYGGSWFAPVLVGEVLGASFAFLALAVVKSILDRIGRGDGDRAEGPTHVIVYVALFAAFGKGWVEPHTTLARALAIDAGPSLALAVIGLAVGLATWRWARSTAGAAAVWALAGYLIVGPHLYARFDHVEAGARLATAGWMAGAALALGGVVAAIGAVLGRRRLRAAMGAVALLPPIVAMFLAGPGAARDRPSVVLVVVDTLRADAVDRRDADGRPLMPRLRSLAKRGVRFSDAVAVSPWTLPSTLTLVSGLNPHRHLGGVLRDGIAQPGDPAAAFLGGLLRDAGYQVAGFVNNPYLRPYYGFGRDFLEFRRYHGTAKDGQAIARSWIARHDRRPYFALVHLMDPHWPYTAPMGYGPPRRPCAPCDDLTALQYTASDAAVREEVRRRYDAEVAFTDSQIGRLYDELLEDGSLANAWFVVTSDHGEEFWEHRHFLHGHSLYGELLDIPLIVVPPESAVAVPRDRSIAGTVSLEDVLPTVLDLADLVAPMKLDGASLVPQLFGRAPVPASRSVVAGFLREEGDFAYAVRSARYKLVVDSRHPTWALYDLLEDPGEQRNVRREAKRQAYLLGMAPSLLGLPVGEELKAQVSGGPAGAGVDADLRRELEGLGYVD